MGGGEMLMNEKLNLKKKKSNLFHMNKKGRPRG